MAKLVMRITFFVENELVYDFEDLFENLEIRIPLDEVLKYWSMECVDNEIVFVDDEFRINSLYLNERLYCTKHLDLNYILSAYHVAPYYRLYKELHWTVLNRLKLILAYCRALLKFKDYLGTERRSVSVKSYQISSFEIDMVKDLFEFIAVYKPVESIMVEEDKSDKFPIAKVVVYEYAPGMLPKMISCLEGVIFNVEYYVFGSLVFMADIVSNAIVNFAQHLDPDVYMLFPDELNHDEDDFSVFVGNIEHKNAVFERLKLYKYILKYRTDGLNYDWWDEYYCESLVVSIEYSEN